MKLISFAVPCYNSAAYMAKCIDSLLVGGDRVEIIIINDGSKDDTGAIADGYKEKYPDIVKVIHKENGGHGSGVNAGAAAAQGIYYKVVDSDDWVDEDAFKTVLETIEKHEKEGTLPDLYITNFVYSRVHDGMYYTSKYTDKLKPNVICDFSDMKPFRFSRMLLMHSLMYKREAYLQSGTVLPEHTFYVDNYYAYQPFPYIKTLCYIDVDFYRYFIGRGDQSVSRNNMFARYEQQIRVMKLMADGYTYEQLKGMSKGLRRYMHHALSVLMMVTMYFICGGKDDVNARKAAYKELWAHIKNRDKKLYRKLRYRAYPFFAANLPWRLRRFVMDKSYNYLCKKICLGQ
ncbi:MAG: glycosyltransferase family 2 protein [Clostridiales bacterium]|nr:glycosyltransferase family 2 protein [Clostridiales bacterium]